MPFTGSATALAALLVQNLQPLIAPAGDDEAQANLQSWADAVAKSIEAWILKNGVASVTPGQLVATTGSPVAQAGATTTPGSLA